MKQLTALTAAVAFLALSSCGKQDAPPPPPSSPGGPVGARPEKMPNGEPSVITVKHVLIAFEGAQRSEQKRSRAEAQKLAYEVLGRAKSGEDFDKLMKEFSNDPGGGTYTLVNNGVTADQAAGEFDRSGMVPAFGDVGFRISLNEIAVAEYDDKASPFGWHVIKRVK
jgi:parvulin-like peptidyl-prolyl isomerase